MRPLVLVLPLAAAFAVSGCNTGTGALLPLKPYVVFESTRDGNEEIYRTDSLGTAAIRLTAHGAEDHQPAYSQDNETIVFVSTRDGDHEIFTMDSSGANIKQLTDNTVADNCPRFSFDGTKIVFQRGTGVNCELWVMDADGTDQAQLTFNAFQDREPSFAPDGRIIFTSHRTGNRQIWIMDADGTNEQALTSDPLFECYQADFSADGTKIGFIRKDLATNISHVHIMDADGSNIVDRGNSNQEFWPRWSDDMTRLVVTTVIGGNEDVYRIQPDGSNFTRLTFTKSVDGHGDW